MEQRHEARESAHHPDCVAFVSAECSAGEKLNISFYDYVRDRILKKNVIPPLFELIQNAARQLLPAPQSFSLACP